MRWSLVPVQSSAAPDGVRRRKWGLICGPCNWHGGVRGYSSLRLTGGSWASWAPGIEGDVHYAISSRLITRWADGEPLDPGERDSILRDVVAAARERGWTFVIELSGPFRPHGLGKLRHGAWCSRCLVRRIRTGRGCAGRRARSSGGLGNVGVSSLRNAPMTRLRMPASRSGWLPVRAFWASSRNVTSRT